MFTNEQYKLMLQRNKTLCIKIEILNKQDIVVDFLEGIAIKGNIDITNSGLIRRNLNATFVLTSKTEINPNSRLWIDKKIKVYVGIKNYFGSIDYFNFGIFIISNPEKDISASGNTITIRGFDKMFIYQNPFEFTTIFKPNTPMSEAVKTIGKELIGETKFMIENSPYVIPYTLQYSPDKNIDTCIKDLSEMYMNYQIYYNADGYLVYEQIKNRINDSVIWEFKNSTDFHTTKKIYYNYDNVKNYIKILGRLNEETGVQPRWEESITGLNNIYSIDRIGRKPFVVVEDKYTQVEQCKQRAIYEKEKHQNLANTIRIETVPIYLINDVNKLIRVYDYDANIEEIYQIDSISVPLSVDGTMGIEAHKIFN